MKKSLLINLILCLFFCCQNLSAQTPNYVPTNGLIGWWPFNGNANDESGNGNNGTINGATITTDRFGNTGKAYSFDGINNYFSAPNNQTSYAISFWFNTLNLSGVPNCNLYNFQNTYAEISSSNGSVYSRAQYPSAPHAHMITNYIPTINNWHHMVVNYDAVSKQIDMYIDNTNHFVSTLNASGGTYYPADNNNTFYFGGSSLHNLSYFNGKMDDIGIWNRPLTQQEISNLYNANICYQTVTVTDTLIINANITGFNPITYQNSIKIYPNPTNDHILINFGNNFSTLNGYTLKITNSLSQVVYTTPINTQQTNVDLSTWTGNGIYFVHIIDGQGNTIDIRKIVLQ